MFSLMCLVNALIYDSFFKMVMYLTSMGEHVISGNLNLFLGHSHSYKIQNNPFFFFLNLEVKAVFYVSSMTDRGSPKAMYHMPVEALVPNCPRSLLVWCW